MMHDSSICIRKALVRCQKNTVSYTSVSLSDPRWLDNFNDAWNIGNGESNMQVVCPWLSTIGRKGPFFPRSHDRSEPKVKVTLGRSRDTRRLSRSLSFSRQPVIFTCQLFGSTLAQSRSKVHYTYRAYPSVLITYLTTSFSFQVLMCYLVPSPFHFTMIAMHSFALPQPMLTT